jgi:E3 ubiquitin-protein ligase RNF144
METQTLTEIVDPENDDENDVVFISGPTKRGTTKANAISVESYDCDGNDDVKVLWFKTPLKKEKKPFLSSVTEPGESSAPPRFECGICADEKPREESFSGGACEHAYCADCTAKYVAAKLSDNVTAIPCPWPECAATLEPERCRRVLSGEVFERWGMALCEALVLGTGKTLYCPFKDCSAPMLHDGGDDVAEASCPSCHRMFCAACRVRWHAGVTCEEFRRLGADERAAEDIMLVKLAASENWQRCPRCKFYVERSEGCLYMKCRFCSALSLEFQFHSPNFRKIICEIIRNSKFKIQMQNNLTAQLAIVLLIGF